MTNYKGSEVDIVMMTDFTNEAQNAFLGKLIDTYLPTIKWGYDKCGYACSDHASWNRQGYPVSMPFESKKNDMNGKIHTGRDTIEQSGGTAEHAAKFARMGVAFVLELDK
jgi:leucyl aminopeptidase